MRVRQGVSVAAYIITIVAANWLTAHYGLVPIGFDLMVTAGTFAAGFALIARDAVQLGSGRVACVVAILVGALVSAWTATPAIAVASGVAFLVSELVDMGVFTRIYPRSLPAAVVVSSVVGAPVDTVLFLHLAGFPLTWQAVLGQFLVKTALALVVAGGGGMHYLSGSMNKSISAPFRDGRIGLLQTPRASYRLDGVAVWAMDNGCFTDSYPGDEEYLSFLARFDAHRDRCLFVAAPDVVGDAEATLLRSAPMLGRIRAAGWPTALVLQDGMRADQVPWALIDWVFVGGSTGFKLGAEAEALIRAAQAHEVRVHVGRVNSGRRFARFAALGCDSADGTCIAFDPKQNTKRVLSWVAAAEQQQGLVFQHD